MGPFNEEIIRPSGVVGTVKVSVSGIVNCDTTLRLEKRKRRHLQKISSPVNYPSDLTIRRKLRYLQKIPIPVNYPSDLLEIDYLFLFL